MLEDRGVHPGKLAARNAARGRGRKDRVPRDHQRHAGARRGPGRRSGAGRRRRELQRPRGTGERRLPRARRPRHHVRRAGAPVRARGPVRRRAPGQSREEGIPEGRPERRGGSRPRPDTTLRRLGGRARAVRRRPATRRGGVAGRRRLQRDPGPVPHRPSLRRPPHHMNPKARQELIGVGAFVVGTFLGLTLLPWPITGGAGEGIGTFLWAAFGAGAVLIPVMGLGWALAAFDRLGSLSTLRAVALGPGLIVLIPYTV